MYALCHTYKLCVMFRNKLATVKRILPKKKNRSLQVLLLTSKGQNLLFAQVFLAHDTDLPVRCAMNLRTYW